MVVFNPQVQPGQDNSPNFRFDQTRPITQPKSDTSSAIATATLGEGIEGATKLADTTVKDVIKQDVYNRVDTERDAFTTALNTVRNAQTGTVVPAPVQTYSGSTVGDLTATPPAAPVPPAIDVGLNKVDAVQSALVNGKINDTYYTQRLNAVAKDLRTQYPGYREYIDQRISEATGVNPANAYITNLMQDINRAAVKKDDDKTKTETMLRGAVEQGVPNSDVMLNLFRNGQITADQANTYIYSNNAQMYKIKQQEAIRAANKGSKEDIASSRTEDFTREMGFSISNNFSSVSIGSGTETPAGILNAIQKAAANPDSVTDQQAELWASKLNAQKQAFITQYKLKSNQLVNGHSYSSDIGADKADALIKSQAAVFDPVLDALKNKDFGLAFHSMNQARAILDDTKSRVLQNPDVGQFVAKSKTFLDTMGPNWTNLVTNQGLRTDMDDKFRALYNESSTDARLGTPQPDGTATTISDHIGQAKGKGVTSGKYYNGLVGLVDDIKNKDAPAADKANIARYLYDPKNYNILNNFKMDYTDPVTGKQVPGKYSVWTRLTNPDVTDEMAKMSKSDPNAGNMYKNWAVNTGRELIGEDVRTLNHFTGHDDVSFRWDNENHQLVPLFENKPLPPISATSQGVTTFRPDEGYRYQIQKVVNRINMGLNNLSHVNDSFGGDTNAFVLNTLQQYGLDINGKYSGIPKAIGDAIAASRTPQRKIEDTFDNLNSGVKK